MSTKLKIVFRVDASILIGSGHVMRCMTLAEELRTAGADVRFIVRSYEGNLNSFIRNKRFKLYALQPSCPSGLRDAATTDYAASVGTSQEVDSAETVKVLENIEPDWLIVDHYGLDKVWEKLVRPYVKNIMVIDDLAVRSHDCDILLDQNYTSGASARYLDLVPPTSMKLLGPSYALLRRQFAEARRNIRSRDGTVKRLLIFFGGTDAENMTGLALRAISQPEFGQLEVDVVLGAAYPHRTEIKLLVESRPRIRLHVQVDNVAKLMAEADLALCAGGSSTWERLCIGLPSLVVTIADNQVPFTNDLHEDGLLRWLGTSEHVDAGKIVDALRNALSQKEQNREWGQRGMELVDGHGSRRVARQLLAGPDVQELIVRKAAERDCALLWHWVNEPEVRQSSFNTETVSWETHKTWFASKLQDPNSIIYVIESAAGPVGEVRFQRESGQSSIHYSLARQYRGFGLGKTMLALAIKNFRAVGLTDDLIAEVKSDNIPSCKIFERLSFQGKHRDGRSHFLLRFSRTEFCG